MLKTKTELATLRKSTLQSLLKERSLLRDETTKLQIRLSLQKEKNTASRRVMRKKLARINTVIEELGHVT